MTNKENKIDKNSEQQDFFKTTDDSWDNILYFLIIACIFGFGTPNNTTLKEIEQDKEIANIKGKLEVIERLVTRG